MNTMTATENPTLTQQQLIEHWQGHRALTRKTIELFPEDKLFTYSIGGMRPFSELILEFLSMAVPGLKGIVTRKWNRFDEGGTPKKPTTKKELLDLWDADTRELNELWPKIPMSRLQENDLAFGQWEGPVYFTLFYLIDNEIHHRGQAYVYLRSLGVEPPPFWERN